MRFLSLKDIIDMQGSYFEHIYTGLNSFKLTSHKQDLMVNKRVI